MASTNALQRGDIILAEPPAAVKTLINVPYMLSREHKHVQMHSEGGCVVVYTK